jgi:PleD family two-component response regulator
MIMSMEKLSPNSNTDKHPDGSLSLLDGKRTLVSGNNPLATEIATSHEIIIMENVKNLELEHELTHSSMIPELYNKKGFLQVVDKALSGYKGSAAMIYFDANKFKQINDTHGHAVGDAVINWQIVPVELQQAMSNPDKEKAQYAQDQLMKMKKIIIKDLYK